MVDIKIDGKQCDFCSVQRITLKKCANCSKDICDNHAFLVDVVLLGHREAKLDIKDELYVCPTCIDDELVAGAVSTYFNNVAIKIIEEKNKPPPEEPEVLPP